jgi:transcriptional regulator with XRE-family HTH domain
MALTSTYVRLEADRRIRRLRVRVGDEIRSLRLDAGATLTELSRVTKVDRSHLRRIEAGEATASIDTLVAIGVALGADLSFRYFAGIGPRLVDRFQAPMVEALLARLDRRWTVRLEVPVDTPRRGVIDSALIDPVDRLAVAGEFQSEFRRLEQQIRWSNEKADGLADKLAAEGGHSPRAISRLLVVRSTVSTRETARAYEATLAAAYPAKTRDVLSALTTPTAGWPGAGIVWMRVDRGRADLMDGPPRGVRVGR